METSVASFTHFYYASGLYRQDYEEVLGRELPRVYRADPAWPNYESLRARINARYAEWARLKGFLQRTEAIPSSGNSVFTAAA